MKYFHVMESIILVVTTVLCILLLLKILYNLRSVLSWRVNCWFCNSDFWVKFIDRNSWTCRNCDQYNGFTKDGDYNKTLTISSDRSSKSPKLFQRSSPKNGLCKMCNINQQLKITQLANFVPMNEKKFDEEIECYRNQLEKAYKLCSPCRKVLQIKLHKEKETLLDSKLLETRTTEKITKRSEKRSQVFINIINATSRMFAAVLMILIIIDCYRRINNYKNLSHTVHNIVAICKNFLERLYSIVKMEMLLYFPSLNNIIDKYEMLPLYADTFSKINYSFEMNDMVQKALASFVCFIQIVGHFWNSHKTKYSIVIDVLWAVFIIISMSNNYLKGNALIMDLMKLSIIFTILLTYQNMKYKTAKNVTRRHISPKKMTKHINNLSTTHIDYEDNISLDTDDDVSLSKFGLHNLTGSSSDTNISVKNNLLSGRSFTPRKDSLWTKPKHNSTFCVNSMISSNASAVPESVFIKPSFNKYQNLCKDDSDSDLDESINSLCISSPKKRNSKVNPVFALRKFTASPNFIAPSPMNRSRPLISPSKLGHGTSWVAGGYWGSENERQVFNVNGSRSSSQSSGFESQGSSMNQRNIFSQPPSREESVCGEQDKTVMLDRFQNFNMATYNYQNPTSFTPINSPVFPQMHYNSHVQIPQPRFPQQNCLSQNIFARQQYSIPNSTFKAPGGSKLIKLPQETFTSQCSTASQFH